MIRIVIVDDHEKVRKLLRGLLDEQPDFEVLADAEDGKEGLRLARELNPDVVITDLKMQGIDGLAFTRELREVSDSLSVIIFTMYGEPLYVRQTMDAGARGYVVKGGDLEELVQAIRDVSSGGTYISPSLAAFP